MHSGEQHDPGGHHDGAGTALDDAAAGILRRGYGELLNLTGDLAFGATNSERYPHPLTAAVYGETPDPDRVRGDVAAAAAGDPLRGLEPALVLAELLACHQPEVTEALPDDGAFLGAAFATKRLNGWIALLGVVDEAAVEADINSRWQFRFLTDGGSRSSIYALLNMVVRYGFVYGRIPAGDSHALGHFIEDFAPGLLVCGAGMDDLQCTLSLAAMKLGIPAIVTIDYPFSLGRHIRVESLDEIDAALPAFPNIRRLLDLPDVPKLPDYLSPEHANQEVRPAVTWGDGEDSFFILRKGEVSQPGVEVTGQPDGSGSSVSLGVIVTADAQPLDAFDRRHIESQAAGVLPQMDGVAAELSDGRLIVGLAESATLPPQHIGEALIAAIRHEFPRLERLHAQIILDAERLASLAPGVRLELSARQQEIDATTESDLGEFVTCVGCSPFAPDHVCVVTPERPPQCGRSYDQLRAGALYGYDDMTNIHHRVLHSNINSYGTAPKREAIDERTGEWAGINEAMWRLTGGRTRRLQLHSLDAAPHTGCGCFRLVMFEMGGVRPGIGIMDRGYQGQAPDGRTWEDLHYALAGKQTPGIAGAAPGYLSSPRFLAGHGGWDGVVWVSPGIAATMGEALPGGVEVGTDG